MRNCTISAKNINLTTLSIEFWRLIFYSKKCSQLESFFVLISFARLRTGASALYFLVYEWIFLWKRRMILILGLESLLSKSPSINIIIGSLWAVFHSYTFSFFILKYNKQSEAKVYTTLIGWPALKALMFSTQMLSNRWRASLVAHAICGVI